MSNRLNEPVRVEDVIAAEPLPESRPSFARRHLVAIVVAAAAVAVVLVSGLTAWAVGASLSAPLTSSHAGMAMPAPSASAIPDRKSGGIRQRIEDGTLVAARGTVTSIDGSTWVVTTRAGKRLTLTVDSATRYGTRAKPASVDDFAAGDPIVVVATRPTADSPATVIRISPGSMG